MRLFPVLRRSRVRVVCALGLAIAGLAAAIGAAISTWYASSALTSLLASWFASAGLIAFVDAPHALAAVGLSLAGLALLISTVSPPHRSPAQAPPSVSPPRQGDVRPIQLNAPLRRQNPIPAVSIYVDAENTPFPRQQLPDLLALLNREIGSCSADRFYYADAHHGTNVAAFRDTYFQGGFQLVDVPHKSKAAPRRPDGTQTVNAVDVAMALHVLERAIRGPEHQTIFLVTADRDYFPLISRLKNLGHAVTVWARSPTHSFARFCMTSGVSLRNLDDEVPLRKEPPAVLMPSPILPLPAARANEITVATLQRAIEVTLEQARLAEQPGPSSLTPGKRYTLFKTRLGGADQNILRELGYDKRMEGWDRFQYWIAHLQALHVLAPASTGKLPRPPADAMAPTDAARLLHAFLQGVAATIQARAKEGNTTDVRYVDVANDVARDIARPQFTEMAGGATDGTAQLRALLLPNAPRRIAHMRCFCSCARQLGLVSFGEDDAQADTMHEVR